MRYTLLKDVYNIGSGAFSMVEKHAAKAVLFLADWMSEED
jgi:hypothetical protein